MPVRNRSTLVVVLAASLAAALAACGSSGGDDPATTGPADQAIEQLRAFGLTADQASCVVDEVGADAVVEASDLNAFADSEQYRLAAEACIDDD